MGDVNFVVNNLYGNYADKITLTPEQMQAANLQGIGGLRDLREAAALSEKLALALKAYSEADSKEAQQALLENLVEQWAATNPYFGAEISISNQLTLTTSEGIGLTPAQARAMQNQIFMVSEERQQMLDETARKLAIVNAFSGIRSSFIGVYNEATFGKVAAVTDKQYATLMKSIYEGLLFQTRLQPYLNAVTFTLANGSFEPDFSGIKTAFEIVHAENPKKAFVDLSEFIAFSQNNDKPVFAELSQLQARFTQSVVQDNKLEEYSASLDANVVKKLGTQLGSDADDALNGNEFANYLSGGKGDDRISGGNGNDILDGGSGSDKLYGGSGNDTLIGGTGNDYLEGSHGNDTYVFAKGHGQDVVYDYSSTNSASDSIVFTDVDSSTVKFRKDGNDLMLFGYHNDDSIIMKDFFYNQYHEIENFVFADKTITLAEFRQNGMSFYGTEGSDNLSFGNGKNIIYAGAGDDTVHTGSADDVLDGGSGNDKLYGGSGSDILIGGAGNDYLEGGSNGADTYIFAAGHGKDIVSDYGSKVEHIDTLVFEEVLSLDALFEKSGNDLLVKAFGNEEQVSVSNYFSSGAYRYVQFAFEDKLLSAAEVSAAIV